MTAIDLLYAAAVLVFFDIIVAVFLYEAVTSRWFTLDKVATDADDEPVYVSTMWIDGEPYSVQRPLYHAPRHNRGTLHDDLSLEPFEKDDGA